MGQNSNNLLCRALLDKGIINDNVLGPGKSVEIRIAVAAAFRAIDGVQVLEREVEPLGKGLGLGLELALLERGKSVEQGEDKDGVDGNHESLEEDSEEAEVEEELVAGGLNDLQEGRKDRSAESEGEDLGLDEIGEEKSAGRLVEAELLLDIEGAVVGLGKRKERRDKVVDGEEDDALRLLASEPGGEVWQKVAGGVPEHDQQVVVDDGRILRLVVDLAKEAKARLGLVVLLGLVERLLINLALESYRYSLRLELLVLAQLEVRLERVLREREADDDELPWDIRPVQLLRKRLWGMLDSEALSEVEGRPTAR